MYQASTGILSKNAKVVATIMAGGHGTRFWPASRCHHPKQFLQMGGDSQSLIQLTVARLRALRDPYSVLIVTANEHAALAKEHVPDAAILVEPIPRNTAACLGFAAVRILKEIGDIPMLCLPADHFISEDAEAGRKAGTDSQGTFQPGALMQCIESALHVAKTNDVLITLGIRPVAPETGYGYIHRGDAFPNDFENDSGMSVFRVRQFVEKPNRERAEEFLKTGEYYWNSGMFVWRPRVLLNAIKRFLPELHAQLEEIGQFLGSAEENQRIAQVFDLIKPISVDFGVMEKSDQTVVVPASGFHWCDVGSWSAWADCFAEKGKNGNFLAGEGVFIDSKDCTVLGGKRFIAVTGLQDIIVVETEDAILVCNRGHAQEVKRVVDYLKEKKRNDLL